MRPIVIIAISVGCSVVAVLGVLLGLEMYATNEAQKAYAIELERQAVCERLYDGYDQSLREIELWGVCINYGISEAVNDTVLDCGTGSNYSSELCRLDTKILAMKVVNEELTLDTKFRNSFTKNLNTLQDSRNMLFEQRQYEEQQNKIKFTEMKNTEKEWESKYLSENPMNWYSTYQECLDSEIQHYDTDFLHGQLCDNSLKNAIDQKCDNGTPNYHCGLRYADVVADNVNSSISYNTEQKEFEEQVNHCTNQGGTYLPIEEVKGCMCKSEIDYYAWYDLCRNNDVSTETSISVTMTNTEPEQALSQIKIEYYECIGNEQYGTGCQDKLQDDMDQYCRITTNSHTEYDACFGQITKIQ